MYADLAPKLRARGWTSLIPLVPQQKRPAISGWDQFNRRPPSDAEIAGWARHYPDGGVGLAVGPDNVVGVDLDWTDPLVAKSAAIFVKDTLGPSPLVRIGLAPKLLVLYRRTGPLDLGGKAFGGFEVFQERGQFVMFGVHPATGKPYRWPRASPLDVGPLDLPLVTGPQLVELIDKLQAKFPSASRPRPRRTLSTSTPTAGSTSSPSSPILGSGAAAQFLQTLRASKSPLSEACRLVAASSPGDRYPTAFGCVVALAIMGASDADIRTAVVEPYLVLFTDRRERRERLSAIETGIKWARLVAGPSAAELRAHPGIASVIRRWRESHPVEPVPSAREVFRTVNGEGALGG